MAEPFLVNAPSRTLRELYGDHLVDYRQHVHRDEANKQLKIGIEQEERHGLYAALKAKRPKRNWFGGRKEELVEQEVSAYQPKQLTEQPQRYTVQEQLRRQRQIADSSGVSETTTNDGIYWFTVSEDSEVNK